MHERKLLPKLLNLFTAAALVCSCAACTRRADNPNPAVRTAVAATVQAYHSAETREAEKQKAKDTALLQAAETAVAEALKTEGAVASSVTSEAPAPTPGWVTSTPESPTVTAPPPATPTTRTEDNATSIPPAPHTPNPTLTPQPTETPDNRIHMEKDEKAAIVCASTPHETVVFYSDVEVIIDGKNALYNDQDPGTATLTIINCDNAQTYSILAPYGADGITYPDGLSTQQAKNLLQQELNRAYSPERNQTKGVQVTVFPGKKSEFESHTLMRQLNDGRIDPWLDNMIQPN